MSMKKLTLVLFTIFLVSSSQLAYASLASILFTFTTHMWLAVFADWRNKSLPHFSTSHFLLSKRKHNSLEAKTEKNSECNKWMNMDKTVWAMEFYLITSVTARIALYIILNSNSDSNRTRTAPTCVDNMTKNCQSNGSGLHGDILQLLMNCFCTFTQK